MMSLEKTSWKGRVGMADHGAQPDNAQPEGKSKQEDKSRPVDTVKPEGGKTDRRIQVRRPLP